MGQAPEETLDPFTLLGNPTRQEVLVYFSDSKMFIFFFYMLTFSVIRMLYLLIGKHISNGSISTFDAFLVNW